MNKLSQYIVAGDKLDSSPGSSPLASFPDPSPRGGGGGGGGEGLGNKASDKFALHTTNPYGNWWRNESLTYIHKCGIDVFRARLSSWS